MVLYIRRGENFATTIYFIWKKKRYIGESKISNKRGEGRSFGISIIRVWNKTHSLKTDIVERNRSWSFQTCAKRKNILKLFVEISVFYNHFNIYIYIYIYINVLRIFENARERFSLSN